MHRTILIIRLLPVIFLLWWDRLSNLKRTAAFSAIMALVATVATAYLACTGNFGEPFRTCLVWALLDWSLAFVLWRKPGRYWMD